MGSKIAVDVSDDEILVTMPGTSFSIIYERTKDNRLIASHFSGRKVQDERGKMSFPHFLSLAWTAANEKAREIGWIVCRRRARKSFETTASRQLSRPQLSHPQMQRKSPNQTCRV